MEQTLDQSLPAELQNLVKYGGPLTKAVGSVSGSTSENVMAIENTNLNVLSAEQIKDLVVKTVASINADQNREVFLTGKITELVNEANIAKAKASALGTDVQTLTLAKDQVQKDLAEAKASGEKASVLLTTVTNEKAAVEQRVQSIENLLATANKKILDLTSEKVIASRTEALTKAELNTEKRLAKAIARTDKGEFAMSDEAFTDYVADLTEVVQAEAKKSKKDVTGKNLDTPPTTTPGKTDDLDPKGNKVESKGVKADASTAPIPAIDIVPQAPNLNGADQIAQAQASILAGQPTLTADRVSRWSDMFPA